MRSPWVKGLLVILVLGLLLQFWFLRQQAATIEGLKTTLGAYWSNDIAGMFIRFDPLQNNFRDWSQTGQADLAVVHSRLVDVERVAYGAATRWSEIQRHIPELPAHRHLIGFLDQVHKDLYNLAMSGDKGQAKLSPDQRTDFARSSDLLRRFETALHTSYPEWNNGLPTDSKFWGLSFWTDPRWRTVLADMDQLAAEAGFAPLP